MWGTVVEDALSFGRDFNTAEHEVAVALARMEAFTLLTRDPRG